MERTIFITYSSKDQRVARTICAALENRGLSCWISARDVKPGQNFQEQIVKAIRAARIMVLVFTANANNSSEIKKELALASQNKLVVIPVRIEDVIPNEAFAYEFATRQWVDLFGDWENAIAQLAEMVAAAIDEQLLDGRAEGGLGMAGAATAAFMRRSGRRWAIIGGLAVIVAAAVAYEVATLQQRPVSVTVTKNGVPTPLEPAAMAAASSLSPPGAQAALPGPNLPTAQPPQQPPAQPTVLTSSPAAATPSVPMPDEEMVFWGSIKDSKDTADFREYLKQYPAGRFAGLAKNRLAAMKPAKPTPPAAPSATSALGSAPASAPTKGPGIHVTAATLGANCGARRGNVTSKLADICDGQAECGVPGHAVNYPDPAYGCPKDFAAEWQCGAQSQIFSNSVPAVRDETNALKLSCH